jgi:hypothetical protein
MVTVTRRMGVRRYFIGMSCNPGQLSEACFERFGHCTNGIAACLLKWLMGRDLPIIVLMCYPLSNGSTTAFPWDNILCPGLTAVQGCQSMHLPSVTDALADMVKETYLTL